MSTKQARAINIVLDQIKRDISPEREYIGATFEEDGVEISYFDPWDIFPSVYGSYSSEFDALAIKVLQGLTSQDFWPTSLAEQIFQEMLCTADLCEYGTSPRGCWPVAEFSAVLPTLIDKWKAHAVLNWGEQVWLIP